MSTYATSTVKLYYTANNDRWELLPNKLFIVESIEDYLATKTAKTITLFQYVKHELETGITVDLSQTYAEPLSASYKYVSITNSDTTKTYYYFVKNVIWRSKSSVRFELVMDVLNTFKEGTDYNFKANTRIIREHKNRFESANVQVKVYYEYLGGLGTINVNDVLTLEDDQGTEIIHGKLIDYDQDYMTIADDTNRTPEQISELLENAEPPLVFIKDASHYVEAELISYSFDYDLFRKIDYVSEGITPILQCGSAEGKFIENTKTLLNTDWYLLYRNQNDPTDSLVNPVECYLIPAKTGIKVNSGYIENGRLVPSFIEEGKFYYFPIGTAETPISNYTLSNGVSFTQASNESRWLCITKTNGKLNVVYIRYWTTYCYVAGEYNNIEYIDVATTPVSYRLGTSFITTNYNNFSNNLSNLPAYSFSNSGTYTELDIITQVDRTDAKNIKLIKLPYVPYNFTYSGSTLNITDDNNWELVHLTQTGGGVIYVLKLKDLNTDLNNELNASSLNYQPLRRLSFGLKSVRNPQLTDLRKEDDPKLLHSDFFRPTYVYDSFSYIIQMEKLDLSYYKANGVQSFYIDFDMTKTINSRFMFTFNDLVFNLAVESYANYMPIARNNEEVLYNVPYISYIRNGFNYDVKAKNLSNASNWIGTGLSALSVGVSLAMPTTSLKVAGVVASLVSMAMTTKSAITSTIQNEENIARKQQELKNQTSSVAGSDDVDLMSIYAENRLKYLIYEPTPIMKNMLNDLFFYAGYYSNRIGLPNHNTRVNFDYLEADAVIEKTDNIPNDCLEELINSFKNGVSYIHKTARASNKWDLAQQYENWEKTLF